MGQSVGRSVSMNVSRVKKKKRGWNDNARVLPVRFGHLRTPVLFISTIR